MCPLIPVVRDSPTLPARPVGGLSSARSPASRLSAIQQLVLVGSTCCRLRLAPRHTQYDTWYEGIPRGKQGHTRMRCGHNVE